MNDMIPKRVLFLTGTRADYGKIKPLIRALDELPGFDVFVFVCGMHLSEKYGSTYNEVIKDKYKNIYVAFGLSQSLNASVNLGNTICCLAGYVENIKPDMIVVHGDRMDALAGAVVGALNNIIVAHIEGGELSGTIDESIRHAISKFAHIHFVCNDEARQRLIQLGEEDSRIFTIGSPDIDIMMSKNLPTLSDVKERYQIGFENYAILMYHPVTTEYDSIGQKVKVVVDAILQSNDNFIVIYPNNDMGSEIILNEYKRFSGNSSIAIFPSLRFECFLTLLKNTKYIIGNSSAGIRESGIYGIPAIDIGSRQAGRYSTEETANVQHTGESLDAILKTIKSVDKFRAPAFLYGDGNSTEKFSNIVSATSFWDMPIQKHFIDLDI